MLVKIYEKAKVLHLHPLHSLKLHFCYDNIYRVEQIIVRSFGTVALFGITTFVAL